jgi:hypothetical protein
MEQFDRVASNDLSKNCPTQTHYSVADRAFWLSIKGKYSGIITEPPHDSSIILKIVSNSISIGIQFCALLIDQYEKTEAARIQPPFLIVSIANLKLNLCLWINIPNLPSNKHLHFGEDILHLWKFERISFNEIVKRKVIDSCFSEAFSVDNEGQTPNFRINRPGEHNELLDRALPEYRKEDFASLHLQPFNSPTYKGKVVLQEDIVILGNKMSKRRVMENFYQMPYRSAQRKIRIAKYLDQFPEMNRMTQREAEIYLSKKLKCEKEEKFRRKQKQRNKQTCL